MKTTLELPGELFRRTTLRAAQEGITFAELIARYVAQELSAPWTLTEAPSPPRRERSDLPVARAATGRVIPHFTNAESYDILESEELPCAHNRF